MTIYTHALVGLGLGRILTPGRRPWWFWVLTALLPVTPDLDSFSTAAYGSSIWGHRGFTHSLGFALAVALVAAGLTCRRLRMSFWMLAGLFFVVMASHGLLDALTRGGADIPFFWPLSDARYGNWASIPVPDIGFELPDPRRSRAFRAEIFAVWIPTLFLVGAMILYRWSHPSIKERGRNS
jgi:inner membrane protein